MAGHHRRHGPDPVAQPEKRREWGVKPTGFSGFTPHGIRLYHGYQTHCPQGHPYAGDNLIRRGDGWRECRACGRARSRQHYWKRLAREGRAPGPWNRAKTHCPQGHEYAGDNVRKYGHSRHCRTCNLEHSRRRRQGRAAQ